MPHTHKMHAYKVHAHKVGIVSGEQFRQAISARSNFGLGFALTHILIKSDDSHRRKLSLISLSLILTSLLLISIAIFGVDSCLLN